ncbi:MAG TPA: triose-phosphate isomerase [Flavobacterium sp.]|nr:triose-phosphate isomerase [Flavobacterium sp.]
MRKNIVAGNWKMNNTQQETLSLLDEIRSKNTNTTTQIIVAPSFVNLPIAVQKLKGTSIKVAAQNAHQSEKGAFTGEVSIPMLKSIEVDTVILGHSERRAYFGETNALLAEKVNTALEHNFSIIFCFGEELNDRKTNMHFEVVATQIKEALFHLAPQQMKNIVLAYEPVWAIGTGETATPEQVQDMHAFIRQSIATKYGSELADQTSILYGGSVNASNAKEIFAKADVDGGLIGGAALKADDFLAIVNSF